MCMYKNLVLDFSLSETPTRTSVASQINYTITFALRRFSISVNSESRSLGPARTRTKAVVITLRKDQGFRRVSLRRASQRARAAITVNFRLSQEHLVLFTHTYRNSSTTPTILRGELYKKLLDDLVILQSLAAAD